MVIDRRLKFYDTRKKQFDTFKAQIKNVYKIQIRFDFKLKSEKADFHKEHLISKNKDFNLDERHSMSIRALDFHGDYIMSLMSCSSSVKNPYHSAGNEFTIRIHDRRMSGRQTKSSDFKVL